jgi:hypothetical protein
MKIEFLRESKKSIKINEAFSSVEKEIFKLK